MRASLIRSSVGVTVTLMLASSAFGGMRMFVAPLIV